MFQQKYFFTVTILIYVTLFGFFNKLQHKRVIDPNCFKEVPCVRFCCKTDEFCDKNYIDKNFNATILGEKTINHENYEYESNEDEFKITNMTLDVVMDFNPIFGEPICSLVSAGNDWFFVDVSL